MSPRRHFPTIACFAPLLLAVLPAVCPAAPCPAPTILIDNHTTVTTDCVATPALHVPQTTEFVGSFEGRNAARTLGGQSTYEGHVIFLEKPRAVVEGLLPPNSGLHLAAPSSTATDPSNYPVLVMYGLQSNLSWNLAYVSLLQPQYQPYYELVLLIPFVQKDGGSSKWHNYIVRMYLNWQLGVDVGIAYYGYQKRLATFGTEALPPLTSTSPTPPGSVQMSACSPTSATSGCSASSNGKQFTARMLGVGAWGPSSSLDSLDSYQAMKSILSMPVLGTCEAPNLFGGCYMFGQPAVLPIIVTNGAHMCSYFVFTWDSAQARRESAELAFLSDFSLQGGNLSPWVQQVMSNVPDGAFGVKDLNWQLTLSQACVW